VLDIRGAGAIARQPSFTVVAEQVFDKRQGGLVDQYRIFTHLLQTIGDMMPAQIE
jgi:hypothetical protein